MSAELIQSMPTVPAEEALPPPRRRGVLEWLRETPWQLPVGIVAVGLLIALFTPGFIQASNIRAILESASLTGIVAVSATSVTLSGNFFSLSTQQSAILGAVLFAYAIGHGWNVALAIAFVLVAGALTGLVQGAIIAAGLNAIITTLAAGSIMLGAIAWASQSQSVSMGTHTVNWLGIHQVAGVPPAVIVFVLVVAVLSWISAKTTLGRRTLLSGANRETAALSGISVKSVTVWSFVIAGVGAAIAGILSAAVIGYANTQFFGTLTFDAIAAVLVGGTAIKGGFGSPLRSAYGAVLIALINNAMLLHQFSSGAQQTIEGALVVVVIIVLQSSLIVGRK